MNDTQFVRIGKAVLAGFCSLMIGIIITFAISTMIDKGAFPFEGPVAQAIAITTFAILTIAWSVGMILWSLHRKPVRPPKLTQEQQAAIGFQLGALAAGFTQNTTHQEE